LLPNASGAILVSHTDREEASVSANALTCSGVDAAGDDREALVGLVRLDAIACGAAGLLLAAAAPLLDGVLGIPGAVLAPVGLLLFAYAGLLALLARRGAPRRAVAGVIAGNALWALASVVVVVTDGLTLTPAGGVVVLLQAVPVAALAALQLRALRRARA
jgi:hypothetical protein